MSRFRCKKSLNALSLLLLYRLLISKISNKRKGVHTCNDMLACSNCFRFASASVHTNNQGLDVTSYLKKTWMMQPQAPEERGLLLNDA